MHYPRFTPGLWQNAMRLAKDIGMNAITIYVGSRIIDFAHVRDFFLSGAIGLCDGPWRAVAATAGLLLVQLALLWTLHRKRIYLRL